MKLPQNQTVSWTDCIKFNYPHLCVTLNLRPHILNNHSRTVSSMQMFKIIEKYDHIRINCDMFRCLIARISRTNNNELIEIFINRFNINNKQLECLIF